MKQTHPLQKKKKKRIKSTISYSECCAAAGVVEKQPAMAGTFFVALGLYVTQGGKGGVGKLVT